MSNHITEAGFDFKTALTVELAKSLIGKEVILYYSPEKDRRVHYFKYIIQRVTLRDEAQLGQEQTNYIKIAFSTQHTINMWNENSKEDFPEFEIYDWQGIFRITSSAHIIYVKEVA